MRNLKLFFLVSVMLIGISNVWAAESVYKTALFGTGYNSNSLSSYSNSWSSTNKDDNDFTVNIENANNNNNGWTYIRMGSKNDALVGSITTAVAIDKPITKVVLTIDNITADNINTIRLSTSNNGSNYTYVETSFSKTAGTQTVKLEPTANLYYRIEVDCKKATNGSIQISKVEYYIDDTPIVKEQATIILSEAGFEREDKDKEYYVGDSYQLPTDLTPGTTCGNKVLVGWSTVKIEDELSSKPKTNFYELGKEVTLQKDNVFYAVFADLISEGTYREVTDKITSSTTGVTGSSYTEWSNKVLTSGASYSGKTATSSNQIQINTTSPQGIVSTISGGILKRVIINWGSTSSSNNLNIYGSTTQYSGSSALYGNNVGTIIGTCSYSNTTPSVIEITDGTKYNYVGIKSASGVKYISSIEIIWIQGSEPSYSKFTTTCSAAVDPVNPSLVVTPKIIDFSSVAKGGSVAAKTIKVQGDNLTSKTLKIEQAYDGHFTLSTSTINVGDDGSVDTELTITPTSEALNTAGTYEDLIIITAEDDELEKEIEVTLKVLDTYTVSWYVNGAISTTTQVVEGNRITELPTAPIDDLLADCDANKFMGWTEWDEDFTDEDVDALDLFNVAEDAPEIKGNTSFYAVFAQEEGDFSWIETFDNSTGTAGWSGNAAAGTIKSDNEGWTYTSESGNGGSAKFGTSSKAGSAETPSIPLSGSAILTFSSGAWSGDKTEGAVKISVTGALIDGQTSKTINLKDSEWQTYRMTLSEAKGGVKIKFEATQASKNRFFLDNIQITTKSYSNYITSCHIECPELVAPTLKEVTELYDNTATLNWNAVTDATKYHVIVKQGSKEIVNEYTSETQYVVTGLTEQTEYTYSVQAVAKHSSCDESQTSDGQFTTTEHQCKQLPKPTNLKIVREADWKYTLSWDAVPNATKYMMSGVFSGDIQGTSSTRSITVTPGNTYIVRVTAIGDGYNYCNSEEASIEFTAAEYFTITFDPGYGYSDTESAKGGAIELPEATSYCEDWTFVGWSDGKLETQTTEAPTTLYKSGTTYYAQADKTLYAVYSKEQESLISEEKSTTLTATDFGLTTSYNEKTATKDGYSFIVNQGYLGTNNTIQMNSGKGSGILYNSTAIPNLKSITLTFNSNASKDVTVYQGTSKQPSSNSVGTTTTTTTFNITTGNEYFSIKVGGGTYFTNIIVTYMVYVTSSVPFYTSTPPCKGCENSGAEFEKETVKWGTALGSFASPEVVYATGKENLSARTYSSTNTNVATVNPTTGYVTVKALGSTIIKMTQPRYVRDNAETDICAVEIEYLLQVGPSLDVVEWQEDGVIIHVSNGESNPKLIVSGEQEFGEGQMVADDLFFSKYFEAEGNTKLLAVFNGTDHSIDLTNINVWHYSDHMNLAEMLERSEYYEGRTHVIYPQEELIFYNKGEYSSCAEEQDGFETWIDCEAAALKFGGKGTLTLRRTSDDGKEEIIDIIGAYENDEAKTGSVPRGNSWRDNDGFVCEDGTNYLTGEDHYALSTNRCLLIRKNTVTSGAHAVETNVNGEFETLCEEWTGMQIITANSETKGEFTCKGFAEVGGFDYNDYYKEMVQIAGSDLSGYLYNADEDLYKFEVTVSDYACLDMEFQLVNPDDQTDIWAQETVKVPILVSGQTSTADELFTNIIDGYPDLSKERCSECDVVVLENASLTLNSTSDNETNVTQLRGIKVYPGGELIVEDGTSHHLRNIAFRRKDAQVASAQLNGNPTLTKKLPYSLDLYVSAQNWHFITLPYDCRVADVTYADGTKAKLGAEWFAMYYDGAKRVENKARQTCWTEIKNSDFILKAGVGYIVGISGYDNQKARQELRFPMADLTSRERQDKFVPIKAYGAGQDITPNHKGWNLVGNPYLYNYRESNAGAFSGLTLGKLTQLENNTRDWVLDGSEIPYIAIPINNGDAGYEQLAVAGYDLPPFTCYFVQAGNDQHSDNDDLGIEFKATNKVKAAATSVVRRAPEEYTDTDAPVLVTVSLANSQGETDHTSLVLSDRFLPSYEMGADLVKWFGDNYRAYSRPVLYSIASDGQRAFNALSQEAALQAVPLGIYTAAQGDYTFSLVRTETLARVADVWLHDAMTGTYTNLMQQDYTFNTAPADGSGRFSLSVRLVPQTATAVDNTLSGCTITSAQGTLTVGNLPPHASLWLYDTSGRLLHAERVNHVQRTYEVPQAGVYYVRVESENNEQILRTIVK